MRKLVKMLSLILAFSFVSVFIAGCGSAKQKEEKVTEETKQVIPQKEEPLKFVYHNYHNDKAPEPDNEMGKWLKENKNVDIQYESELLGDRITDKMNLMLASGDVPDVTDIENYDVAVEVAKKMGEAGIVIQTDEWLNKYPNLIKYGDKQFNDAVYKSKKDGKMYMIPTNFAQYKDILLADVGPIIREDWLKQVGMDAPKTTDELYEVLKAFRDKIPDVNGKKIIPASFDGFRQFIGDAWTKSWIDLSADKKTLYFQWNNPEVEGFLVYMNKLYREKLLDPEALIQKPEQYMEKLSSGRVGFTVRIYWDMDKVNAALKDKDAKTRFIPSPPIRVAGKGFVPVYANTNNKAFSSILISSKFAKDQRKLERLMEFLNWNASDEGVKMLKYGLEGKYYEKNKDGLLDLKPEFKLERDKPNSTFTQRTGLEFYNLLYYIVVPVAEVSQRTEESKMGTVVWKEATGGPLPIEYALTPPGSIEQQKWGAMWGEFDKWSAKAIFAKSEEECHRVIKEMLKAYETNGGRDIVNERLKSIQDFIAKQK